MAVEMEKEVSESEVKQTAEKSDPTPERPDIVESSEVNRYQMPVDDEDPSFNI